MKRALVLLLAAFVAGFVGLAAQTVAIIKDVRGAIANNDFVLADKLVRDFRAAHGTTPEMLEALSWIGRGKLAAKDLDGAEKYARETYQLATAELKKRKLDQEPRLPIALGAAIEVMAQADAQRGARTEAVTLLRKEMDTYAGTSIIKRLQKNVNLISLEGQPAPAIDLSEYLGPKPPTLQQLKGNVVLMFFWAHWCGDCRQQAPILAALAEKYRGRGLVIFAPTQRFGYVAGGKDAPPNEEKRYIEQVRQTHYPVLAEQPVPLAEANHLRYGVSTTPTLVLLDRAGIVRLYNPGRMTMEQLEPLVAKLVNQS